MAIDLKSPSSLIMKLLLYFYGNSQTASLQEPVKNPSSGHSKLFLKNKKPVFMRMIPVTNQTSKKMRNILNWYFPSAPTLSIN